MNSAARNVQCNCRLSRWRVAPWSSFSLLTRTTHDMTVHVSFCPSNWSLCSVKKNLKNILFPEVRSRTDASAQVRFRRVFLTMCNHQDEHLESSTESWANCPSLGLLESTRLLRSLWMWCKVVGPVATKSMFLWYMAWLVGKAESRQSVRLWTLVATCRAGRSRQWLHPRAQSPIKRLNESL